MNIKQIAQEIHQNNKEKGFWDEKRNTGELLMLVVSELAEALEADRKNKHCVVSEVLDDALEYIANSYKVEFEKKVKDTFEDEIADSIIRLLDLSEGLGIDIEWHIKHKLLYNKLRGYKHNKKY